MDRVGPLDAQRRVYLCTPGESRWEAWASTVDVEMQTGTHEGSAIESPELGDGWMKEQEGRATTEESF